MFEFKRSMQYGGRVRPIWPMSRLKSQNSKMRKLWNVCVHKNCKMVQKMSCSFYLHIQLQLYSEIYQAKLIITI
jgi:hypothetical protein